MSTEIARKRAQAKAIRDRVIRQRLFGLALIVLSIIILCITANGVTVEDRDGGVALFTLPIGLYLLFTRTIWVY